MQFAKKCGCSIPFVSVATVLSAALSFCALHQSVRKPAQMSDAVWTFDLAKQGYVNDPGANFRSQIPALRSVSFIDENTVVATFIERVVSSGLHRRDDPNRTPPFKMHAVFLDVSSGKFLRAQTWDSDASAIGVLPGPDGTYIDYEGNVISKYARDGSLLQTLRIPGTEKPGVGIWALAISPTGRTMLAQYRSDSGIDCEWIRSDTMKAESDACQIPENASISDNLVAAHEARKNQTDPNKIYVSKHGTDWKSICTSEDAEGCAAVSFLSDSTLLAYNQDRIEILQTDGTNLFRQDVDHLTEVAQPGELKPSASSGGRRVAILLWTSPSANKPGRRPGAGPNGETETALSPRRILVLDVQSKKWIFSLEGKKQLPSDIDFALSPNGEAIVVKTGGAVSLFRVADASN